MTDKNNSEKEVKDLTFEEGEIEYGKFYGCNTYDPQKLEAIRNKTKPSALIDKESPAPTEEE